MIVNINLGSTFRLYLIRKFNLNLIFCYHHDIDVKYLLFFWQVSLFEWILLFWGYAFGRK